MTTAGGAMAGYCETGRRRIDSAPASMMTMAMTQAKIGRSMKKRAMTDPGYFAGAAGLAAAGVAWSGAAADLAARCGRRCGRCRSGRLRLHRHAGADLLQAFDDDAVAGGQPLARPPTCRPATRRSRRCAPRPCSRR